MGRRIVSFCSLVAPFSRSLHWVPFLSSSEIMPENLTVYSRAVVLSKYVFLARDRSAGDVEDHGDYCFPCGRVVGPKGKHDKGCHPAFRVWAAQAWRASDTGLPPEEFKVYEGKIFTLVLSLKDQLVPGLADDPRFMKCLEDAVIHGNIAVVLSIFLLNATLLEIHAPNAPPELVDLQFMDLEHGWELAMSCILKDGVFGETEGLSAKRRKKRPAFPFPGGDAPPPPNPGQPAAAEQQQDHHDDDDDVVMLERDAGLRVDVDANGVDAMVDGGDELLALHGLEGDDDDAMEIDAVLAVAPENVPLPTTGDGDGEEAADEPANDGDLESEEDFLRRNRQIRLFKDVMARAYAKDIRPSRAESGLDVDKVIRSSLTELLDGYGANFQRNIAHNLSSKLNAVIKTEIAVFLPELQQGRTFGKVMELIKSHLMFPGTSIDSFNLDLAPVVGGRAYPPPVPDEPSLTVLSRDFGVWAVDNGKLYQDVKSARIRKHNPVLADFSTWAADRKKRMGSGAKPGGQVAEEAVDEPEADEAMDEDTIEGTGLTMEEIHKHELDCQDSDAKEFADNISWVDRHHKYVVELQLAIRAIYETDDVDGRHVPDEELEQATQLLGHIEERIVWLEEVLPPDRLSRPTERGQTRPKQKVPMSQESMVKLKKFVTLLQDQFAEIKSIGAVIDERAASERVPKPLPRCVLWLLFRWNVAYEDQKKRKADGLGLENDEIEMVPLASTFPVKDTGAELNDEQRQRMHWLGVCSKEAYDDLPTDDPQKMLVEAVNRANWQKFARMDYKGRSNRPYLYEEYEGFFLGAAYGRHSKRAKEGKIWKPDYLADFSDAEVKDMIDRDNKSGVGGPKVTEIRALEILPWYFAIAPWMRLRRILEHQVSFVRQRNAIVAKAQAAGQPPPAPESLPGVPACEIDLTKPSEPLDAPVEGSGRFGRKKAPSSTPTSDKVARKTHEWQGGKLVEKPGEAQRQQRRKEAAAAAVQARETDGTEDVEMADAPAALQAAANAEQGQEPGPVARAASPEDRAEPMHEGAAPPAAPAPAPAPRAPKAAAKPKYTFKRTFAIGHSLGGARFSLRCLSMCGAAIIELLEK